MAQDVTTLTPASETGGAGTTLLDIRKRVVKESGRYDLVEDAVNDDWTDVGCNVLIQDAQDWLDRKFPYPKQDAWLYKALSEGEGFVSFQRCRFVKEVWVATTSLGRSRLTRKSLDWLKENYADVPLSGQTTGTPLYWAPVPVHLAPDEQADQDGDDLSSAGLTDYDFLAFTTDRLLRGIAVLPPADGTYTLEILAAWHSLKLTGDTDVSFWSTEAQGILVRATKREIELQLNRNSQGIRDLEEPLLRDLQDIYFDMVSEEVSGPPETAVMEG